MILLHGTNKTSFGVEWDIELIDILSIEQAIEELGKLLSTHGYFVSMFDVWGILKIQFFEQKKSRDIILIPASNYITDYI